MRATLNVPDELGAHALDAALEGLVGLGVVELSQPTVDGQGWPTLYTSGVQYQREGAGSERWLTPSQVIAAGVGDCEDLAAYRTSELRVTGEDPDARARVIRSGPRTWHAIVERGDGRLEDPSRVLGMGAVELGSMGDWEITLRREGRGTWVATLSRGGRGVVGIAPYGHDALAAAAELGALGFIPGLDILSRAAQGALSAALPTPPAAPAARAPIARAPLVPAFPAGAASPFGPFGEGGTLTDASRRIAQQISRIATTEARRKLREATTTAGRAR